MCWMNEFRAESVFQVNRQLPLCKMSFPCFASFALGGEKKRKEKGLLIQNLRIGPTGALGSCFLSNSDCPSLKGTSCYWMFFKNSFQTLFQRLSFFLNEQTKQEGHERQELGGMWPSTQRGWPTGGGHGSERQEAPVTRVTPERVGSRVGT